MRVEIRPLFETTLAEPVQLPGSSIRHKKGAAVVFNNLISTRKFGALMFIAPQPTHLMLNEACRLAEEIDGISQKIIPGSTPQVFSKLNADSSMTGERALKEDPEAKLMRCVPKELAYAFLQKLAAFHFHLMTALEAFCNQMIPNDIVMPDPRSRAGFLEKLVRMLGRETKPRLLTKPDIERFLTLEEKLELVATLRDKIDVKQKPCWKTFKETKRTRDDVVHLKNGGVALAGYEDTYARLFDSECEESVRHIVELMNYLVPNLIKPANQQSAAP